QRVAGHELNAAMRAADVVIAHAGVGATMSAFDAGRCPVLVPRRAAFGEHIDDHQREIASHLANGDLAVVREVPDLEPDDLLDAAGRRVVRADPLALFPLLGPVPG